MEYQRGISEYFSAESNQGYEENPQMGDFENVIIENGLLSDSNEELSVEDKTPSCITSPVATLNSQTIDAPAIRLSGQRSKLQQFNNNMMVIKKMNPL